MPENDTSGDNEAENGANDHAEDYLGESAPVRRVDTGQLNDARYVRTEAELAAAIGEYTSVVFAADVTLTGLIEKDVGDSDVRIDLNGHTLRKADGVNQTMLALTTGGDLTLKDGLIDCNRPGQDFPAQKSKEVRFWGRPDTENTARLTDVKLIDNTNFSFELQEFNDVVIDNPVIDSHPREIAKRHGPHDANAGLDGIHTFDCERVAITNPEITSGDDCIAIGANDITVRRVDIQGGHLSSPVHANGVKLHIQWVADPDTTIKGANIDTYIHDCRGQGVTLVNESENGNAFEDVVVDGVVRNVGDGGVRTFDPVKNLSIRADIHNPGDHGIDIAGGAESVQISSVLQGGSVNGINAVDAQNVTVTGSVIRDFDNWPIITKGASDNWTVVGNAWYDNQFDSLRLLNDHNVVANNNRN